VDAADELEARVQVVDEQRVRDRVGHVQDRAAVGRDARRPGARGSAADDAQRAVKEPHDALAPAHHREQPVTVVAGDVERIGTRDGETIEQRRALGRRRGRREVGRCR
jgi:hypothetical protein